MTRTLAILGATGSIGSQALDIVEKYPDRFRAVLLSARKSADKLFEAARRVKPLALALSEEPNSIPEDLRGVQWFFGPDAGERALLALKPDDALAAVVGVAGLPQALCALKVSKRLLLANKEALVTGGELVTRLAKERGAQLLPVDSEHSAILQCLQGAAPNRARRLILTASGGALRDFPAERIESASVNDVLRHPTWRMGAKITVDCASMMNKGLEVIEAARLFGADEKDIDVVVHPESVIHSMVEFSDGAVLAQLGAPDMRTAIGYALGYPERLPYGGERLDFARLDSLSFQPPDTARFPCLLIAREAYRAGGDAPAAMNGANEAAVEAFLGGSAPFGAIARTVRGVMDAWKVSPVRESGDVYEADRRAREMARALLTRGGT